MHIFSHFCQFLCRSFCMCLLKKKNLLSKCNFLFSNVSVISGNAEHDRLVYSSNLNRWVNLQMACFTVGDSFLIVTCTLLNVFFLPVCSILSTVIKLTMIPFKSWKLNRLSLGGNRSLSACPAVCVPLFCASHDITAVTQWSAHIQKDSSDVTALTTQTCQNSPEW